MLQKPAFKLSNRQMLHLLYCRQTYWETDWQTTTATVIATAATTDTPTPTIT